MKFEIELQADIKYSRMRRITLVSNVNTFTGYGQLFCEIFAGLEREGVFVSVRSLETSELFGAKIPIEIKSRLVHCPQAEEWELLIKNPTHWPTPGKRTIYFTMWESSVLPKDSVAMLNKAELVIVPCAWNKDIFKASGVQVPIAEIPLGYSPGIFNYSPMDMEGNCVFGTAGRVASGPVRKGIGRAMEIFHKTFPKEIEDVELRVKIFQDCAVPKIDDPRIKITREFLPWHKTRKWLSELTAFLSPVNSEGFGLWQLQAMAMGRPIIAPMYSGLTEFFTSKSGYPIPFKEVKIPPLPGSWADFDDADIRKILMAIYGDRQGAKDRGLIAAQRAREFTWDRTIKDLIQVLKGEDAI